MSARLNAFRLAAFLAFFVLALPVLPIAGMTVKPLFWLVPIDMFIRAVPLYVSWVVDSTWLDGGEVGPQLMPLWVILTAVILWPLPVIAIRPALWRARRLRHAIEGYAVAALACNTVAAYWVFTHTGIFF